MVLMKCMHLLGTSIQYFVNHLSLYRNLSLLSLYMTLDSLYRTLEAQASTYEDQKETFEFLKAELSALKKATNHSACFLWHIDLSEGNVFTSPVFYVGPGYKTKLILDLQASAEFASVSAILEEGNYDHKQLAHAICRIVRKGQNSVRGDRTITSFCFKMSCEDILSPKHVCTEGIKKSGLKTIDRKYLLEDEEHKPLKYMDLQVEITGYH